MAPVTALIRWLRDKKSAVYSFFHRGVHGWDARDAWNVDTAHSRWVVAVIDEYMRQCRDHASASGVPASFLDPDDLSDEAFEAARQRWFAILTEIRDGFQAHLDFVDHAWADNLDPDDPHFFSAYEMAWIDMRNRRARAFALMHEHYDQLWW